MRLRRLGRGHLTWRIIAGVLAPVGLVAIGGAAAGQQRVDPVILHAIRAISPVNLKRTDLKLVSFGTRNTLSAQDDPARGIGAARDWIYSQFQRIAAQSGGRLTVALQTYTQETASRIPRPVSITNIVATLHGAKADPRDRVYVLSGHYDSICSDPTDAVHDAPGADDDGSGVALVLESARVLSRLPVRADVVFMCVAGEEQGLYGSTHFARQAKADGWNVEGMLDDDIVGSSHGADGSIDAREVRLFSEGVPSDESPLGARIRRAVGGENDSPSRELARFIQGVARRYVPGMKVTMVYRRDRYLRGGDHIPFLENGYPAVRFTEAREDFRHQHQDVRVVGGVQFGDLPRYVDFDYLAQIARINAAALAVLASAPGTPGHPGIVIRRLSNDTELRWDGDADSEAAGYRIVWRETTSPTWTHRVSVGQTTDYTLRNVCKDDFFFGVEAVDSTGHASPAAFPRPVR